MIAGHHSLMKVTSLPLEVSASMQVNGAYTVPNGFTDSTVHTDILCVYPKCWSIWVKKTSSTQKGVFLHLGHIAMNSDFCFSIGTGSSTILDPGNYIVAEAYAQSYYIRESNVLGDTNWHCFHLNFNSATQMSVYKDGALLAAGASTLSLQPDMSALPIGIGYNEDWDGQRNFAGLCTRLVIWDRPLSTAEITEDYGMGKTGAAAPDHILRYYGGVVNSDNALVNHVAPKDGHLLIPSGGSSISSTIMP